MRTAPNSPMRLLPKAPLSCCGKSAPSLGVVNSRKALKASRPVLLQRRQRTQPCPLACSESVAVALMQDLRNTVAALESEVALRMAGGAELDDSNGAALPLQPAAVGGAAGGSNEGEGSAVCTGFEWTGSEPFTLNYPSGIYTVHLLKKVVNWEASTSGTLRSINPKCTGFTAKDEGGMCASCAALGSSAFLRVIARAAEKDMHQTAMGAQYLTITQQQARLRRHAQSESKYRLMAWKGDARVSRLLRRIDTHKRQL